MVQNGSHDAKGEGLDKGLTLNLVLCGLGAGMLSMPWTQAGTGIINMMVWAFLVLLVTYFTIMLVVRAGEKAQCWTFEELIEKAAPGSARAKKAWSLSATAAIWSTYFLCLVGYMIIIGDSVVPTLDHFGFFDSVSLTPAEVRKAVLFVGQACIFPLCFLNQRQLEYTSALGTFSNCFIVFAVLLNFLEHGKENSNDASCVVATVTSGGNLTCIANLMMAITFQPCVLPMYQEMNTDITNTSRPLRTPRNFARALLTALAILYGLFVSFSVAGFLSFGAETQSNVLNNMPTNEWYTSVGRVCMVGVCLGVYPLMLYPMVAPLEESQQPIGKVVLNISSLVVAFFVKNLGVVNVINGALGIFFLVGLYPAVMALGVLNQSTRQNGNGELERGLLAHANGDSTASCWYSTPMMACLVVLSFFGMVLGLSHTQNDAGNLSRNCIMSI